MDNARFILAILWGLTGFAAYYFLAHKKSHTGQVKEVLAQRGWGMLFLGLVPVFIVLLAWQEKLAVYGLGFSFMALPPWWAYLAIPLIIVASHFQASSPSNLSVYPQIRVEQWNRRIVTLSAASWLGFLLAYEFFFRGFVLFASLAVLDPWPAIALNCSVYGFAHFYKGPGETFGAMAVGILLCYLTIRTGNIWSAFIIHSLMALSNEWFSLRSNPRMKMVRN